MADDVEKRLARARLCIRCTVDDAIDAAHDERARTHRARLDRNVERQPRKAPAAKLLRRFLQSDDLGMCRAVVPSFAHIVRTRDDRASRIDEHGADGHLARLEGLLRLLERLLHKSDVIQHEFDSQARAGQAPAGSDRRATA